MKISSTFLVILLSGVLTQPLMASEKIAVATKVTGIVEFERGDIGFLKMKPGVILEVGDRIRTGKNGFAAIIFIDDKSALKVKENTEMVIKGYRSTEAISKKINLDGGTMRAQVSKQRQGDFIVQTSVSVASVKGTDFWMISNAQSGDQVIGLDGFVTFINLITGDSIDVTGGITGLSTSDGSIQAFKTDPAMVPTDPTGSLNQPSKFEIEFQNPSGKTKSLILEYK